MKILLDTHIALWIVSEPDALSSSARDSIERASEIRLSVVSPWELVIKSALGKITLLRPVEDIAKELEREFGAELLPISLPHVIEVGRLPPHHGDPFDRLLIAQARVEGLTIVTRDHLFSQYEVPLIRS